MDDIIFSYFLLSKLAGREGLGGWFSEVFFPFFKFFRFGTPPIMTRGVRVFVGEKALVTQTATTHGGH